MALTIQKRNQFQESRLLITEDVKNDVHYSGDRSFTFAKALDFSSKMIANIFKEEIGDTDVLTRREHIIHPGHFPDETMFESGSARPRFGRNKLEDPMDTVCWEWNWRGGEYTVYPVLLNK
jgi:hypothetical protein